MKASNFQFLNPYLEEVHFEVNNDFDAERDKMEIQNSFNVEVKRSASQNRAYVGLTLETNLNDENVPFKLQIKVASDFKWEDLSEDAIESMLNFNAPALLLSYMRPIVANITNSSGFPAYNLPFINFKG